ncbi:hypothetical protein T06_12510 [Trichinella sp. T6]|nr:hypothetical protein T06_12510 [Trichinella sp. T6]
MRIVEEKYCDENGIQLHISMEQWVTGSVGGRIRSPKMNRGPWTSDDNWKQTLEKLSLIKLHSSINVVQQLALWVFLLQSSANDSPKDWQQWTTTIASALRLKWRRCCVTVRQTLATNEIRPK